MGEVIPSDDDRFVHDGKGNLFIRNVQLTDEGDYMCTASNVGGSASNVIRLDVHGKDQNKKPTTGGEQHSQQKAAHTVLLEEKTSKRSDNNCN